MVEAEEKKKQSVSVGFGRYDNKSCVTLVQTKGSHTDTWFLQPEAARTLFRAGLMVCDVLQGDDLDD